MGKDLTDVHRIVTGKITLHELREFIKKIRIKVIYEN